jgi:hypothetical protein
LIRTREQGSPEELRLMIAVVNGFRGLNEVRMKFSTRVQAVDSISSDLGLRDSGEY